MQRKVNKQGKRNPVFRSILAKGYKDGIAAWNHFFNVRSIVFFFLGGDGANLVSFQTELATNTIKFRVAEYSNDGRGYRSPKLTRCPLSEQYVRINVVGRDTYWYH